LEQPVFAVENKTWTGFEHGRSARLLPFFAVVDGRKTLVKKQTPADEG